MAAIPRKVVVTGIGMVCALGGDRPTVWQRLLQGKSGIALQPVPGLPDRCAPLAFAPPLAADTPRPIALIRQAAAEAVRDAGLSVPLPDCLVAIGSSRGCQVTLEAAIAAPSDRAIDLSPWLEWLPQAPAIAVAREVGCRGMVSAPMAACATGNWAIGCGLEALQHGTCDVAIVGATDAAIGALSVAGFQQAGALATTGMYPFSTEREGLALGEGAAVLVLEAEMAARQRGAAPYGYVLAFAATNDACHPTAPDPSHWQAERAIRTACDRAGIDPTTIDMVSAHGTATPRNDAAEASLLQRLFGDRQPHLSATKGATGHALGATGAIEAAFCLLSLQQQRLPPCVGLRSPAFDLNFIRAPQSAAIEHVLNLSFGFGGQNAVTLFGRAPR